MPPKSKSARAGTELTTWRVWTYDVWGNADDGYDVNDRYDHGEQEIRIPKTRHNVGTEQEFVSASPTDKQIKEMLDVRPSVEIDTDGDDMNIYVRAADDGYPIGELENVSHKSLSPVRR